MRPLLHESLLISCFCAVLSTTQICMSDAQCPQGTKCLATMFGYSMCSKIGGGVQPDYPTPPSFYCNTNNDCAPSQVCAHPPGGPGICQDARTVACVSNNDCAPGQSCVLLPNLQTACQIDIGGNVPGRSDPINVGGIGLTCQRDSDCSSQQRCVDYHGRWQCMAANDANECNTSLDCPAGKICAYSTFVSRNVCVNPGPVPSIGGNVGYGSGPPSIGNGISQSFSKYPSEVNQNILSGGYKHERSTST